MRNRYKTLEEIPEGERQNYRRLNRAERRKHARKNKKEWNDFQRHAARNREVRRQENSTLRENQTAEQTMAQPERQKSEHES